GAGEADGIETEGQPERTDALLERLGLRTGGAARGALAHFVAHDADATARSGQSRRISAPSPSRQRQPTTYVETPAHSCSGPVVAYSTSTRCASNTVATTRTRLPSSAIGTTAATSTLRRSQVDSVR